MIFLCCCCCGRMGLVFRVTVAIPEGGERGVFGRIGCGWPAGVPWGDVFACIWALMVAPVTDWMWVIGTKLPGIWGREGILLEVVNIEYCFSTLVRGKVLCRILEVNWQNYRSNEQKFWSEICDETTYSKSCRWRSCLMDYLSLLCLDVCGALLKEEWYQMSLKAEVFHISEMAYLASVLT